ncbi:MAG: carboxylesterase/lipase family protein [Bacteroidales bacterium]|nr:carboxylesterase/lipase family protein [Bacteroidales bacterium]
MNNQSFLKIILALSLVVLMASCDKSTRNYDTIKADSTTALVQTEYGKVAGYIMNDIYTFKGIPYAQAERFMPPEKPEVWEGIRSSRMYGPICPLEITYGSDELEFIQQHDFGYMNENCLNLNIWTQGIQDGKKRPVMVWLHGGGYTSGSSHELPVYDGENISKTSDVVLVSVNHRLNVLGFLDLSGVNDKYKYSANAGMLDIVAALEWVRDNIANFGGDPGNVTIFGQSGGGGKVGTLMQMPSAKGLFHKAIMESGAAGSLKDTGYTRLVGFAILEELELRPEQVDSLKNVPHTELLAAGNRAIQKVSAKISQQGGIMGHLGWSPSVDGDVIPCQIGTPEGEGISKDIPLLIGTNKNEFHASMTNPELRNITEAQAKEYLQTQYGEKTDAFIAAVKKTYPDDTRGSDLVDVDVMFRPGSLQFASQKSAVAGGAPVYMYLFTWQSPVLDGLPKAVHCLEIGFVFNNIDCCKESTGDSRETYDLADRISHTWTQFAATGDPNWDGIPRWEPYTESSGSTMLLNNTFELVHHHDKELMDFVATQ